MLTSLMYYSQVSPGIKSADITDIFKIARSRNVDNGLSGILYSDGKWFIQVLEGSRHEVSRIFGGILRDGRHKGITLVSFKEITSREYSDWSMGFIKHEYALREIIRDTIGCDAIVPPDLDHQQMNTLLQRFADERLRGIVPHFKVPVAQPPKIML
jgi:hypothetical protein